MTRESDNKFNQIGQEHLVKPSAFQLLIENTYKQQLSEHETFEYKNRLIKFIELLIQIDQQQQKKKENESQNNGNTNNAN